MTIDLVLNLDKPCLIRLHYILYYLQETLHLLTPNSTPPKKKKKKILLDTAKHQTSSCFKVQFWGTMEVADLESA